MQTALDADCAPTAKDEVISEPNDAVAICKFVVCNCKDCVAICKLSVFDTRDAVAVCSSAEKFVGSPNPAIVDD